MTEEMMRLALSRLRDEFLEKSAMYDKLMECGHVDGAARNEALKSIETSQRAIQSMATNLVNKFLGPDVEVEISYARVYPKR